VSVFADLVGQSAVVAQLREATTAAAAVVRGDTGRTAAMTHAGCSPARPGSGRSVAARAFAAALQCDTPAPGGPGCGHCTACEPGPQRRHPDVAVIVPEGLSLSVRRRARSSCAPRGRPRAAGWQVTLIEDADRLTEHAANALLKAIEEPPAAQRAAAVGARGRGPAADDPLALPAGALGTPSARAVAQVLVDRDGVDPAMASFAARAPGPHRRARRLATDEQARAERRDVLSLPARCSRSGRRCRPRPTWSTPPKRVGPSTRTATPPRRSRCRRPSARATGKGSRGHRGAPRAQGARAARREPRHPHPARRLDRLLVEPRRPSTRRAAAAARHRRAPVHGDLEQQLGDHRPGTTPESTLRRIDGGAGLQRGLDANVAPLLASRRWALALRSG
jgi:DNA polymerase-3 subunit delta'